MTTSSAGMIPAAKDTLVKDSLFDELDQNTKAAFKMWSASVPLIPKRTAQRSVEGLLSKKSLKKGYWKSKRYELIGNKLIKMDSSESSRAVAFTCVENYRLEKIKMEEKGDKDVKYGFRLSHNGQFLELYARSKESMATWFDALKKQCVLTTFSNDYQAIKLMGKGNFARVYYARSKLNGGEFAVKAFEKEKFAQIEIDRPALIKEISILRKLNHPGVIKMHEVYENETHIFLINELLKGGELFHKLKGHGQFDEEYVASLMSTLLDSIKYIANRNILHRDIKPENLILRQKNNDIDLCLADFGLADYYDPKGGYMFQRCGTPGYVAPEVLADKIYDFKVDSFSAGVIMFILLTGSSPFKGKSYDEIVIKNYNCTIDFNYKDMKTSLSAECYDLLQKLLKKEPTERYSAEEALAHPWFGKMKQKEQLSKSGDISNSSSINMALPKSESSMSNADQKPSTPINNNNGRNNMRTSITQLDDPANRVPTTSSGPKDHIKLKCKTPLMNSKWEQPVDFQSPNTWKKQQQQLQTITGGGGGNKGIDAFDSPLHRVSDQSPSANTPGGNYYSQPYTRKTPETSVKATRLENAGMVKMQSVPELDENDAEDLKKQRILAGEGKGNSSGNNNTGVVVAVPNTGGNNQRKFRESQFQSPLMSNNSSNQSVFFPGAAKQHSNSVLIAQNQVHSLSVSQSFSAATTTAKNNNSDSNKQTKTIREKLIQNV